MGKALDPQGIEWQISEDSQATKAAADYHIASGGFVLVAQHDSKVPWQLDGNPCIPAGRHLAFFVPKIPSPLTEEEMKSKLHDMLDMALERAKAGDQHEVINIVRGISEHMADMLEAP